jgi:hypothetical protein
MATLTIAPVSGAITAKSTVCRITVAGAADNRAPDDTGGTYAYYLLIDSPAGVDDGKSYAFNVSADGDHVFNNYVFPAAGSYTVRLRDSADDSDVATLSVTVA